MTRRREPGPLVGNQRLQEVCDQIDTLDACLDALIRAARSAPLAGGAFVEAARPVLMQLRLGLAGRTLPREQAERILDLVRHNLEQATGSCATSRHRHSTRPSAGNWAARRNSAAPWPGNCGS